MGMAGVGDNRVFRAARGLLKDVAFTLAFVLLLAGGLYLYSGVWPPMVSVDGLSMYPNMRAGDLVILRVPDRVGVVAGCDAVNESYTRFKDRKSVV